MLKKQRSSLGFSLIEVLVSMLVIAIGAMGLISLQLSTMQSNQASSYRSQAVWAAVDILDRMRANRSVAEAEGYDISLAASAPSDTSTIVNADLSQWLTRLSNWLPEGDGSINFDTATSEVTITIQWDESGIRNGSDEAQFVFGTQI